MRDIAEGRASKMSQRLWCRAMATRSRRGEPAEQAPRDAPVEYRPTSWIITATQGTAVVPVYYTAAYQWYTHGEAAAIPAGTRRTMDQGPACDARRGNGRGAHRGTRAARAARRASARPRARRRAVRGGEGGF
jgi:hypothetical protein